MNLPIIITTISQYLDEQGAKAIVVGGSVRDYFLGLGVKDYDVEVYGLDSMEELESVLLRFGKVNLVGKSFGVLKFTHEGEEYDFSLPRKESKSGVGHCGFDVEVDGYMSFEQAARRRDFSCNAMGYVVSSGELIDPFGGRDDIRAGVLRYIDSHTFVEDPLRLYRAVQFAGRFGYRLDADTAGLCVQMVESGMLDELSKERVYQEWKKLLLKSPKPSIGFELMRELGITKRYFPQLHALIGVEQSPLWHPEGDVWVHTMMALDEMVYLLEGSEYDERQRLLFVLAVLCHDLGKPATTTVQSDGRIRSIGHDKEGVEPTRSLLYSLTDEHDLIDSITPLVEYHLRPSIYYRNGAKPSTIRKLATKVSIEELVLVARADFLGRTTKESLARVYDAGDWLLEQARELNVNTKPLAPLVQGRDLISLGLKPSSHFKEILGAVYDAQLDGKISDKQAALEFVRARYLGDTDA